RPLTLGLHGESLLESPANDRQPAAEGFARGNPFDFLFHFGPSSPGPFDGAHQIARLGSLLLRDTQRVEQPVADVDVAPKSGAAEPLAGLLGDAGGDVGMPVAVTSHPGTELQQLRQRPGM